MKMKDNLDVKIVQPILEACSNEATIIRLPYITKMSYYTLKKYLFYLIEYDCISYQGEKGVYTIRYEG
jgi:predicted transcriptional regulator